MNKNNQAGGHNTSQGSNQSSASGEDKQIKPSQNQPGSRNSGSQQSGQQNQDSQKLGKQRQDSQQSGDQSSNESSNKGGR